MNELNNIFNDDKVFLKKINKRYLLITVCIIFFILIILFRVEKNNYYENLIMMENEIIIVVDKNYINEIKSKKEIIIGDINFNYSINKIEKKNNLYFLSIKIVPETETIRENTYRILLGKEKIIDYIIRIISEISWEK